MSMMRTEATEQTPSVIYEAEQNTLRLEGRCIPENAAEFFSPVIAFVHGRVASGQPLTLSIKLDYFNTSSSRQLYQLFQNLQAAQQKGAEVKVLWRYAAHDEELLESGQDYQDLVDIPFHFIEE